MHTYNNIINSVGYITTPTMTNISSPGPRDGWLIIVDVQGTGLQVDRGTVDKRLKQGAAMVSKVHAQNCEASRSKMSLDPKISS